jgi:hypothetical protein
MEEIYTLSDGSQVDLSGKSQFEKTSFLVKNPGAKKQKGVAKSAVATSKKPAAQKEDTDLMSKDGSLDSKKWRLPNQADLDTMQNKGILPPPSANPVKYIDDYKGLYDLKQNEAKVKATWKDQKIQTAPGKKEFKTKVKFNGSDEEIQQFVQDFRDNPLTGELGEDSKYKILKAKESIHNTDSDVTNPYAYYSSINQGAPDTFIDDNFKSKELQDLGINTQNFDGFLNKKGYKNDFLDKEEKGLFKGEGRDAWGGYDIGLGKELAKKKLLNMYMEDMQRRDFTKQDLNQDIEIATGTIKEKNIIQNELFDTKGVTKYVEKNFPILTQKLKDRDAENARIYQESKRGGTDFFSWDTASKIGKAGWNAVVDRTAQVSATAYGALGMETAAEGIRMLDEENKLVKPDDRGISYVSGKAVNYKGTNYIVDSKGEIYDKDSKIRVTDLFNEDLHNKIVQDSEYGASDWVFSTQGAAVQTSGIMADMLLQAAVTRGVGELGAIATETRAALIGAKQGSKFTSLLNDTSQLLKKVPLDRSTGYSMVAQGALGYSQGYEDTLKAARDNGINDEQAFKLASTAAQRMAILYSTTGVINPQTNVAENIFGSKNIIKKAMDQYLKVGEKGFVSYIDDIIKSTPRNLLEFAEEGGKEVVQENLQQAGEIGVNRMTNNDAGKKIMNETMTGDDFMNTSILSFISSGLISKMKMPSFHGTDQNIDNLTSLSTLAKNKIEFNKIADGLVGKKVFTIDQINKLKEDVDVYANNINKLPTDVSANAAMPVLRKLNEITKLESEKKRVSKAFHEEIDLKIDGVVGQIKQITYEDRLEVKNKAISDAIKKGVVKDVQMKTFSNTEDMNTYLNEELNIPLDEVKDYSSQSGFALNSTTLKKYSKNPSSISDNAQIIFVNESKSKDAGVIQHEFLHGLLQNTLKDNPEAQKLVGVALSKELNKIQESISKNGYKGTAMPIELEKRLGQYADRAKKQEAQSAARLQMQIMFADGDESEIAQAKVEHEDYVAKVIGVQWEEMLTVYSDILRGGYVTYEESTFTKLGDVLRRVLQYLGIKDIKFESGKDVYNFIKDYNSSVETGKWGKAITKMGEKGAKVNLDKLSKEIGEKRTVQTEKVKQVFTTSAKFSLSDKKSTEQIKKDINSKYDKEKWSIGSTRGKDSNPAVERVLYDILQEYDYIIKGKSKALGYSNLPDFSSLDMISETQMALIPHIRNFNKEFFEKREEFKKELTDKGIDPTSKEFKETVEAQDEKGYKGKKGTVKENNDLNAWINSQLINKMKVALNTGNVTSQKFTEDIEGEMFKESKISDGFGGDETYLEDEGDNVFETEQEYQVEQEKLAILLKDPIYRFTDENGKDVNIETIPFGANFITEASDPTISANRKLKTETDPSKIAKLNQELRDLSRGLELEAKKDITPEEKQELNKLKSFKSYDLSTGMVENTFKALSIQDSPAKIITDEVAREILRSPNIATLEYRNFKEKLSDVSKTMMKRITFEHGPGLESLMYKNWKLLYGVINHPVDPVTGESSYASKKLPPTLKEFDEKGNLRKIGDITRVKFLQAYYDVDDVTRIIKLYGGKNAEKELKQLEPREINPQTGKTLSQNTHFDRRTALRELFGDVMVLQEARRLLRNPDFLEKVAEKQVNLYNDLKDDIIRGKVLESMAKGKSDIVKFSLASVEEIQPESKLLNSNRLLKTQDALFQGIANNVYYDTGSIPYLEDIAKFSLSEVLDQESDPDLPVVAYKGYNKKYENNYKDIYDRSIGDLPYLDNSKNYYIKALQYSDISDTEPGSVKLHTLKSYEEIEREVVKRTMELIDLTKIGQNDINGRVNPFLMQEYKEDYIDKMLQKAIDEDDQAYIDHFTALKNDDNYRKRNINQIKQLQYRSLESLVQSFYYPGDFEYNFVDEQNGEIQEKKLMSAYHNGYYFDNLNSKLDLWNTGNNVKYKEPNGLKLNPFFTYLFLNDVLSNRYVSNAIEQTVQRKPFKRSQYKTTLDPIDSYDNDALVQRVFDNYSNSELKNPAFIYGFLVLQENEKYIANWENNRKVLEYNGKKTFKFDKSKKEEDISSLNSLASRNVNQDALWCTGQRSLHFATQHLNNGDFFIVSDDDYTPVIAVRLQDNSRNGVGEVVGVQEGQSFKTEEMPLISEVFKLSDVKEKQKFIDSINLAHSLLTSKNEVDFKENSKDENSDLLRNVSDLVRGSFFRFELENDKREELRDKIAKTKVKLKELNLINPAQSLIDLMDDSFEISLDRKEEYEILQDTNIITLEEFGVDSDEEYITIDFKDGELGYYKLPNLEEIDFVEFKNAYTFSAPKLENGIKLSVHGHTMEGSAFVELPSAINYDLTIEVDTKRTEDFNTVWLSMEPIDFKSGTLNVISTFDNQEDSLIDIMNAENTDQIYLYGLAGEVILPSKVIDLTLSFGEHENTFPEKVKLFAENIGILRLDLTEDYLPGKDKAKDIINTFEVSDETNIDSIYIKIKEKLTDELVNDILKSGLGLSSKQIKITESSFDPDDESMANGYSYKTTIIKENKENNDLVKFSLAEEENGNESTFLSGLPFSQQWVVARDIDKAINNARMATSAETEESERIISKIKEATDPVKIKDLKEELSKIDRGQITFRVPDISEMTDKEAAYLIIQKAASGYNNFEFMPGQQANTPLLKQVMDSLDFKSKEYQETLDRNSNIEQTINDFIETNKGVASSETFSPETAKNLGKNVGLHSLYIPPEDEDFEGLLYALASAGGKEGEKQLAFMRDNLLKPYSDAMLNLVKARQVLYKDWQELVNKKYKGISKLLKQDSGYGGYLVDQAVRVYLWRKAGYPIPGLDTKDVFHLLQIVRNDPKLRAFADDVSLISKQANGYSEPGHNWGYGSVVGDINNIISKSNRAKFLEHWTQNIDKAFSKENLSKIEAIYGRKYSKALKNSIERMKSGSNRTEGQSDALLNWLNGSNSVVMFANMRSALLQTLGAVNYINTSDNNILKAGAALLNVPQYVKDFHAIWNSDYLKDRRSNLTTDVTEAEIAQVMNDPRNINVLDKMKALNYYILKNGYGPTRVMDSVAIALGGAGFYRNRLNTYLKQGKTQEEAEKLTLRDLYEISEVNQQSADVSKISMNQASTKGRLILAFLNTPFQYSRLIKRSTIDLIKGRGSAANNIAKIVYYGAAQNLLFNFLQNALFARMFDDDEEKKKGKYDTATIRTAMGSIDTLLKGSGLRGVLLSTVAKAMVKLYEKKGDPKGFGDVMLELSSFIPALGIKLRSLSKAYKAVTYNTKEIKRKGFSIHNTYAIEAATSVTSATVNLPADRVYQKVKNIGNALDSDNETWKRIFYSLGYSEENLDPGSRKVKRKSNGEFSIESFETDDFKLEKF